MSDSDLQERESNPDEAEKIEGSLEPGEQAALDQIEAGPQDDANEEIPYRDDAKPRRKGLRGRFSRTQKTIGGVAVITIVSGILSFLLFLPLKLNHIVENLQNRFFGTSINAVQNETDNLFNGYLKKHILPGLVTNSCTSTKVDKSCVSVPSGTNPISKLYTGWSQGRLETTLANKYGIEFGKNSSGQLFMKAPGLPSAGINLPDNFDKSTESVFDLPAVSRSDARQALRDAVKDETLFDRVLFRFKVGRLGEEKYGIKRCLVACKLKDPFNDAVADKTKFFKDKLIERVIQPHSKALADAFACLINPTCKPDQEEGTPDEEPAANGALETGIEHQIESDADTAAETFGQKTLGQLADIVDGINENGGFQKYLAAQIMSKVLGQDVTQQTIDNAGDVVGYANLAAQLIPAVQKAGPKIRKLSYLINSQAMVALYMMYRTVADELKSGNMDASELGSMISSFSTGTKNDGSGVAAEGAPLYSSLFEGDSSSSSSGSTSLLDLFPSSKVYAAAATPDTTTYHCDDGKTPAQDANQDPSNPSPLICPEEKLGRGIGLLNSLSSAFDQPPLSYLSGLANAWNSTIGKVLSFITNTLNSFIHSIPGVSNFEDFVAKLAQPLFGFIVGKLLPTPFSTNMDGGRTFDLAAGGADVLGNDYAHHGLGGQKLSDQQVSDILNEQQSNDLASFHRQPLLARLFDTNSNYSLVTQVAMALPTNVGAVGQNFVASLMSNPFSKLLSNLGSFFSPPKVLAATPQSDAFGISQYGYPQDDPVFTTDPDTYWQQHNCDQDVASNFKAYNSSVTVPADSQTGIPENASTDGCMLIQASVGSAGGLFTDAVLTPDDLGQSHASTVLSGGVSGSAQQIAQQILADPGIQLVGRDVPEDINAAANNQPGTAGVMTSAAILQLILNAGQGHTVAVTAIQSGGTGHCNNTPKSACPSDAHYNGDAVDFGAFDNQALTGRDSGSLAIMQIAFNTLPSGSAFGQQADPTTGVACGPPANLPAGFSQFDDTCDHLHVQVPAGTP